MQFLAAIVLLGILIFVHELGHFLLAKAMGVSVLKFSLGFGPRIVGRKWGETEYQIAAVPFGGFVKMLGDEPGEPEEGGEPAAELDDRAFLKKKIWRRMAIVVAGPLFNIIFAGILFSILMMTGIPTLVPDVGDVLPDSPAAAAGLTKGDRIRAIDGVTVTTWDEMSGIVRESAGKKLRLRLDRAAGPVEVEITPEEKEAPDLFGEKSRVGRIGISPSGAVETKNLPAGESLLWGVKETARWCKLTVVSIVKLIQKVIPAETLGGPILIIQMAGEQAARGPDSFFFFMAIMSVNLGVLNLFPIPILDGGHVLFLTIEAILGRPLSPRAMEIAQKAGLLIILGVMVFALYNDILRFFPGGTAPQ